MPLRRAFYPVLGLSAISLAFPARAQTSTPAPAGVQTALSSVYTGLSGPTCSLVAKNDETGSTTHKCPGTGGVHLLVLADDSRMSVTIVSPGNQEHQLNYWDVVSRGFSSLGAKAEWRVKTDGSAVTPVALIVRVNANEPAPTGNGRVRRSYLAVAKITAAGVCVTDKILASANANMLARKAADNSAAKPCLQP